MKVYRINRSQDLFMEVHTQADLKKPEDCPEGHVAICRYGGGQILWVSPEDLTETEFPAEMQDGFARLDDGDFYPCVCNPHALWNGWACPHFSEDVMNDILKTGSPKKVHTDEAEGEILHHYVWQPEYYEGDPNEADFVVYVNKATQLHYVDGWCWDFYTPEEKSQAEDEESAELFIGEV